MLICKELDLMLMSDEPFPTFRVTSWVTLVLYIFISKDLFGTILCLEFTVYCSKLELLRSNGDSLCSAYRRW